MNKEQDTQEFRDITQLLTNAEIGDTAAKDRIYKRIKSKMEIGTIQPNHAKREGVYMKKVKWKVAAVSAAAVVLLGSTLSSTSFAQEMIRSVLASFQVGNMEITQYDQEISTVKEQQNQSVLINDKQSPQMSLEEARTAMGVDFPASTWLANQYEFDNAVIHGEDTVELQYKNSGEFISLLISQGGENGMSTTDEVRVEEISGKKVYFANGAVLWEHEGFTFELFQMAEKSFDKAALGKIIDSLETNSK
ncbi:hypothetical protein [Paenibacillus agilis]|uniref:DUF4367 domain-containing protein n=1 Tax=Paenibacillus agilis TaxID=3020863 RepID=A0A559IPW6_9BACL|nr:hypothetical protein [Paenibacillus agilis]TVX89689.1 hypothetical protein FPZ44_18170 [Paenibacillus agilis]